MLRPMEKRPRETTQGCESGIQRPGDHTGETAGEQDLISAEAGKNGGDSEERLIDATRVGSVVYDLWDSSSA